MTASPTSEGVQGPVLAEFLASPPATNLITPCQVATQASKGRPSRPRRPRELKAREGEQVAERDVSGLGGRAGRVGTKAKPSRERSEQVTKDCGKQPGNPQPGQPASSQGPHCISALKIDGGTAFDIKTNPHLWPGELRGLVHGMQVRNPERKSNDDRRGVVRTISPVGSQPRNALVYVSGSHRHRIKLEFPGEAVADINARTGLIVVHAKARSLWAGGLEAWMDTWLDFVARLASKQGCTPWTAHGVGWRTRNIELCSDFVGLEILRADGGNFTTRAKVRTIERTKAERLDIGGSLGDEIQTIQIGTRTSPSSMCIYQKSLQLRATKKIDPASSIYAPTWRQSSDYLSDREVTRVELRLNKRSLRFQQGKSQNVIDLSVPDSLLNMALLAKVWAHETTRRRMYVRKNTKARRCPTDPRWLVVQAAAGPTIFPKLQQAREVCQLTRDAWIAKAMTKAANALLELADLHGQTVSDSHMLAAVAQTVARDIDLPSILNTGDTKSRIAIRHQLVRDECTQGGGLFRQSCKQWFESAKADHRLNGIDRLTWQIT